MSLFSSLQISASGMAAQRTRAEMLVENMANADTTRTPEGGPYKRKDVVFTSELQTSPFSAVFQHEAGQGVRTASVAGHRPSGAALSSRPSRRRRERIRGVSTPQSSRRDGRSPERLAILRRRRGGNYGSEGYDHQLHLHPQVMTPILPASLSIPPVVAPCGLADRDCRGLGLCVRAHRRHFTGRKVRQQRRRQHQQLSFRRGRRTARRGSQDSGSVALLRSFPASPQQDHLRLPVRDEHAGLRDCEPTPATLERLTWPQRIGLGCRRRAVIGGLAALNHWNQERDFKPLFSGMAPEDAGTVTAKLRELGSGIPPSPTKVPPSSSSPERSRKPACSSPPRVCPRAATSAWNSSTKPTSEP